MQHKQRRAIAIAVATLMAFTSVSTSQAMTDTEWTPPPSGNTVGEFIGGFGGVSAFGGADLPGVTVIGKRGDTLSNVYVVNVPFTGYIPYPTLDREPGGDTTAPPDPEKQKQCLADCDTKQKIGKDLCDIAAAKAAASSTTTAIAAALIATGFITWKGGFVLGPAAGLATFVITNEFAKNHAATMNLACIAKAAEDHIGCIKGTCKFSG